VRKGSSGYRSEKEIADGQRKSGKRRGPKKFRKNPSSLRGGAKSFQKVKAKQKKRQIKRSRIFSSS